MNTSAFTCVPPDPQSNVQGVAAAVVPRELNQSIFELEIDVGEDGPAAFMAPGVFPCPRVKQVVVGIGVEFLHAISIEFAGIAVFLRREPSFDLERVWIFPRSEGKRFKPGYEVFEMRPAGCVVPAVLREAQRVYVLREWCEDGEPAVAKELIATPNSGGLPMMRSMSLRAISAFCSLAGLIVDICYFFLFPFPLRSFWCSASVILLSSCIFRRILAGISGNPSI